MTRINVKLRKLWDPTINEILAGFNLQLQDAGFDDVTFKTTADGCITYEGDITFNEDGTTSNFLGETGLSSTNKTSDPLNQVVSLQEMVNYNNSITLKSTTVDENGIIAATYSDGSILTQYVDDTYTVQWKYTTPQGVTIRGDDVTAAFTFFDELVNGTDVPQVVTLVLVPLLLPNIFVPLISKLVLYCEFSILLLLLPELPMKIPLTVGEYPRTWESFITVEPPVPINPPVIAASPPVIIPDV